MLRSAIKRVLRSVGYEVRPIPRSARSYPFVSQVALDGVEFSFWVKDATAEQWYIAEDHGMLPEDRLLKDLVAVGDRVLDIGCHQGFYLAFLAKLVGPNGFVLGVDINPENVMVAQAQLVLNGLAGQGERSPSRSIGFRRGRSWILRLFHQLHGGSFGGESRRNGSTHLGRSPLLHLRRFRCSHDRCRGV